MSSGCKNLSSNSLLVVFRRRIKRNARTRTFLNLVPIFTLKCTSALSCFLREKEREICVSFERRRKERSGKRFFKKENHARFLKNNPRRRRRRRRRARLKTRTAAATTQRRQKRTWSFTFKLMCSPLSSFFSSSESILFEMCFLRFV